MKSYGVVKVKNADPPKFFIVEIDFSEGQVYPKSDEMLETDLRDYLKKRGVPEERINRDIANPLEDIR